MTLEDHLKQAATDILAMLSSPPSTTVPSLQAGDTTNQAITEIAKLLKRSEKIPNFDMSNDLSAPRVTNKFRDKSPIPDNAKTHKIPYLSNELEMATPNNESDILAASTLQTHSNEPKNLRFHDKNQHKHHLRSTNPTPHLTAQHLSNDKTY